MGWVRNGKHKTILMLIYRGGPRIGECIRLRKEDVSFDRKTIFFKGGKGRKDRYTVLSDKRIDELKKYLERYRPDYWLFEGQDGGPYSTRSIQAVFRRAVKASGVNPYSTVHTLRHSFATHLLELRPRRARTRELTLAIFRSYWGKGAPKPHRFIPILLQKPIKSLFQPWIL